MVKIMMGIFDEVGLSSKVCIASHKTLFKLIYK